MISIILPTLRPALAKQAVESIRVSTYGVEYEILLVSDEPIEGDDIVHVKEEKPAGAPKAHVLAYQASRGDVIMAFTDDHLATIGWLDSIEDIIAAREKVHFPFAMGLNRINCPWFGAAFGLYYPYFNVMSRRSAEAIGGWYDGIYNAHFSDSEMAMRIWQQGGRCEHCFQSHILTNPAELKFSETPHKLATLNHDGQIFVDRFFPHFGKGFEGEAVLDDYLINYLHDGTFMARMPKRLYAANEWERTVGEGLLRSVNQHPIALSGRAPA